MPCLIPAYLTGFDLTLWEVLHIAVRAGHATFQVVKPSSHGFRGPVECGTLLIGGHRVSSFVYLAGVTAPAFYFLSFQTDILRAWASGLVDLVSPTL